MSMIWKTLTNEMEAVAAADAAGKWHFKLNEPTSELESNYREQKLDYIKLNSGYALDVSQQSLFSY